MMLAPSGQKAACVRAHAQSCPTLRGPVHCSPAGDSVGEISQAGILDWVATSFSRGSLRLRGQSSVSCLSCTGRQIIRRCATGESRQKVVVQHQVAQSCPALCDSLDCSPQAPLPVAFSRQDHWRGVPCPPPGGLPHPTHVSCSSCIVGRLFTTEPPGKPKKAETRPCPPCAERPHPVTSPPVSAGEKLRDNPKGGITENSLPSNSKSGHCTQHCN